MSTDPAAFAPHVESRWRDDFIVELRLRDVPGDVIGDALAEVEAHCADAGQDAATAFGDPVAYARRIAEVRARRRTPGRDAATVVVQTAGVMGVVWAVPPWLHGELLAVSRGMASTVILTLVVAVVLCFAPAAVLGRFVRARWWQAALAGSGVALALAALAALVPDGALTAPAAPVVLVSVVLLVVGAVALHASGATADVVRTPGDADAAGSRRARRTAVLLSAALPAVALVAAGLLALLPH